MEPGEPEWLPEDRDLVDTYLTEQKIRRSCGHWPWQRNDIEGLEPGYLICQICAELGPYEDKIRRQNRDRQLDEHGLTFGFFPPRSDNEE